MATLSYVMFFLHFARIP